MNTVKNITTEYVKSKASFFQRIYLFLWIGENDTEQ